MLFCRIGYFPTKLYEIPLVLFSSSCAPFSGLLSLGRKLGKLKCSLYHGVGLLSLIFVKRKGATVSKVLEKRVHSFCYIIKLFCAVGYAEELREVRKIIYKAVFCGRSDGSTIFVTKNWLYSFSYMEYTGD